MRSNVMASDYTRDQFTGDQIFFVRLTSGYHEITKKNNYRFF